MNQFSGVLLSARTWNDRSNPSPAFLSYQYVDKRTIDYLHTEVPEEFRGTGLALDLAKVSSSCFRKASLQKESRSETRFNLLAIFPLSPTHAGFPDRFRFRIEQQTENEAS